MAGQGRRRTSCFFAAIGGLCVLGWLESPRGEAQEVWRASRVAPPESLNVSLASFERNINTFAWGTTLDLVRVFSEWAVAINQTAHARLIRVGQASVQREYVGSVLVSYDAASEWSPYFSVNSLLVTDNRAADLGRTSQHRGLLGVAWTPAHRLRGTAGAGLEFSQQENQEDKGLTYSLGVDAPSLSLDEFNAGLSVQWAQSRLGRRQPHDGDLAFRLMRDFGVETRDSLVVHLGSQRREFYTAGSPTLKQLFDVDYNVFERQMSSWDAFNQLQYRLSPGMRLTVEVGIVGRTIDRRNRYRDYTLPVQPLLGSRISEFLLQGNASIDWIPASWMRSSWGIFYTEREERHTAESDAGLPAVTIESQRSMARRLDNVAARTTAQGAVEMAITGSDRLQLQISGSILRYDTPDTLNTDDRDELNISTNARYMHEFGSLLTAAAELDLHLSHLVYLSRFQSANNQWNRVLRLAPSVEYRPWWWIQSVLRTEVLANYTVSDFEEQVASVRSFSFRQVSWSDSSVVRLTRRLTATVAGGVRLTEKGILRWREFKERPEDAYVEKSVWPQLDVVVASWRLGVGYRYFAQDRYTYQNGNRTFAQSFESLGPTGRIIWAGDGLRQILMEGWREEQRMNGLVMSTIPNVRVTVTAIL